MVALNRDQMDQGTWWGRPLAALSVREPEESRPPARRAVGARSSGAGSSSLRSSDLRSSVSKQVPALTAGLAVAKCPGGSSPSAGQWRCWSSPAWVPWPGAWRRDWWPPPARAGERGVLHHPHAGVPGAHAYVAVPGDTVWSIAVRFAHGGDPDRWSSGWRPRLTAVFYSPGNGWPCPEP